MAVLLHGWKFISRLQIDTELDSYFKNGSAGIPISFFSLFIFFPPTDMRICSFTLSTLLDVRCRAITKCSLCWPSEFDGLDLVQQLQKKTSLCACEFLTEARIHIFKNEIIAPINTSVASKNNDVFIKVTL